MTDRSGTGPLMLVERRRFVVAIAGGLLGLPLMARAQPPAKVLPRIGFLGYADAQSATEPLDAFLQGLRELGWVDGQTMTIEYRWARGQTERLPELAVALVRAKSDVIVVSGGLGLDAARQATTRIPIVIAAILIDPASAGFVSSLAHPGGNITGLASQYEEVITKQVQLLTETVPGLSRLAFLGLSSAISVARAQNPVSSAAAQAAATLGLSTRILEVREKPTWKGRSARRAFGGPRPSMSCRAPSSMRIVVSSLTWRRATVSPPCTSSESTFGTAVSCPTG